MFSCECLELELTEKGDRDACLAASGALPSLEVGSQAWPGPAHALPAPVPVSLSTLPSQMAFWGPGVTTVTYPLLKSWKLSLEEEY